jgi:hypothetical protein
MLSNKTVSRLFFAAAAVVAVSASAKAQTELRSDAVVAPGVNCSDGNRQMCEKIITQTGEVYKYYI